MSLKRKIYLVALLAVSLISMIWFFVSDKEKNPPEETSQVEACDSCTARHSNLTRLRDARSLTVVTDE
jgi:hypothetical protein